MKIIIIIICLSILMLYTLKFNNFEHFTKEQHNDAHSINILNSRINLFDSQLTLLKDIIHKNTNTINKNTTDIKNINSKITDIESVYSSI